MADSGLLAHDDEKGGGALRLTGGADDQRSLRAYAGPRTSEPSCGLLAAYTEGELLARLFAMPQPEAGGRLQISAFFPGVPDPLTVVTTGSAYSGDDRWGFFKLRASNRDRDVEDIVRLDAGGGGGHTRGRVEVRDAVHQGVYGWIMVGDAGPEVFLRDGARSVRITVEGVAVEGGDKAGFFDLVAEHPRDPSSELHYTVIEGPEAGLYVRGTAHLEEGEAVVELPEHFGILASEEELTVQLTPRDRRSMGVAASELTPVRLHIAELMNGRGCYPVDYQVNGVRKGREGYQVVRPRGAR
jgi:hypothetical protein